MHSIRPYHGVLYRESLTMAGTKVLPEATAAHVSRLGMHTLWVPRVAPTWRSGVLMTGL